MRITATTTTTCVMLSFSSIIFNIVTGFILYFAKEQNTRILLLSKIPWLGPRLSLSLIALVITWRSTLVCEIIINNVIFRNHRRSSLNVYVWILYHTYACTGIPTYRTHNPQPTITGLKHIIKHRKNVCARQFNRINNKNENYILNPKLVTCFINTAFFCV